jgi:hypothetical protein
MTKVVTSANPGPNKQQAATQERAAEVNKAPQTRTATQQQTQQRAKSGAHSGGKGR